MDDVSTDMIVTWWTPSGWTRATAPADFVAAWNKTEDWDAEWIDAGYEKVRESHEYIEHSPEIWGHKDGHLFAFLRGTECFLVAREHAVPFWIDKFPALIQVELRQREVDAAEQLAKAMVCFTRHGHGVGTIDEYGERSLEQMRHEAAIMQRKAAERRKSSAQ